MAQRIGVQLEGIEKVTKAVWKREIKTKIVESIKEEVKRKEVNYRKMRHQYGQEFARKRYLKEMGVKEASSTIRRRLEMLDIGNNQGKNRKCERCKEKETTEHLIECSRDEGIRVEWLKETESITIIRKVNKWIKEKIEQQL